MNQYRIALRGLIGEFVSRRLIGISILLIIASIPLGSLLFSRASQSRSMAIIVAITGITAFSNAAIWAKDSRLNQLLLWPISRPTLARSSLCVGSVLFAFEFGLPQIALFISAGNSPLSISVIVGCSIVVYCATWSILLLDIKQGWIVSLFTAGGLSIACLCVPTWLVALSAACVLLVGTCFATSPPSLKVANSRSATTIRNYYAATCITDQRIWVNAIAVIGFGSVFLTLSRNYPLAVPLGLSVVLSASVLTTMMSRDPDTLQVASMLGVERKMVFQYWRLLFVYFLVVSTPLVILVLFLIHGSLWIMLVVILVSAAASTLYVICEVKFPLHGLRTEKEILKHPRQYGVLFLSSFLLITGYLMLA